ncbi:MucR family transcriptional regulator [Komagataeibacter diospyri]|uniref:MucR family transcriptional regulator n=1 Tax=Komagataeibacter diospyri TaxID=1932662 RepID=UPI0037573299
MHDHPLLAHDHRNDLRRQTVNIVLSYINNNKISSNGIGQLIRSVYDALNGEQLGKHEKEPKKKPAVPIGKSVFPEYIICLEDGTKRKMLKRYLHTVYGMTVDEYRERWGLPQHYPMVAPNYAIRRSSIARVAGFGRSVRNHNDDNIE